MTSTIKRIILGSMVVIMLMQIGCASASKKSSSGADEEDCNECEKKRRK